MDPFTAALGPLRLTEGRTAHQTLYAPFPTPLARRSSTELLDFLRRNSRPRSRLQGVARARDRAFAGLLQGRLDAAIAELEAALEAEPYRADLLSDLSALYGHRARVQGSPEDRFEALARAERAVRLNPDAAESRFNLALALEHLFLWEKTRDAWQRYLALDPRSPWAAEARRHLRTIALAMRNDDGPEPYVRIAEAAERQDWNRLTSLASKYPWDARRAVEDLLLPRWLEFFVTGHHAQAHHLLPGFRRLADLLARSTRDRIFQVITTSMERVAKAPSAHDSFEKAVEPLQLYRRAVVDYGALGPRNARPFLRQLAGDSRLIAYPSLEARRRSLLGVLAQMEDRPQEALAAYRDARQYAAALGEQQLVAWLDVLIAQSLESLGQPGLAWAHLHYALGWSSTHPARGQLLSTLDTAVLISLRQRRPQLALHFQDRLLHLAQELPGRGAAVGGRLRRARIEAALGRTDEASLDLRRAEGDLSVLTPEVQGALAIEIDVTRREIETSEKRTATLGTELRDFPALESLLPELDRRANGELHRDEEIRADRNLLQQSRIEHLRQSKLLKRSRRLHHLQSSRTEHLRLKAQSGCVFSGPGRPPSPSCSKMLIAWRELIPRVGRPPRVWITFQARSSPHAGEGTSWKASGQDPARPDEKEIASVDADIELQARGRLPARTAFVQYYVDEGRLQTRVLRENLKQNSFGPRLVYSDPATLEKPLWTDVVSLVQRLDEIPPDDTRSRREILSRLSLQLLEPWHRGLAPGVRLLFAPTHELYRVPFAALIDPRSGRFLVQDHPVGVVPSPVELLTALQQDRRLSARPLSSILLVGDAAASPGSAGIDLPPLPGASREIESLAGIYRGLDIRLLRRGEATTNRVLAALPAADVVHFGTHAIRDFCDSWQSALVLSPQKEPGPGLLPADQVLRLHLSRTRLVVLAACDTYCGRICPSEGPESLATAFLAAGVPAVVGSLRPVADASTSRLFIRFHQELRRGADALSALRTAQLAEIAAHPKDWTWASFQLLGGVVERTPGPSAAPLSGPSARIEPGQH